jgi:hypothetical protein
VIESCHWRSCTSPLLFSRRGCMPSAWRGGSRGEQARYRSLYSNISYCELRRRACLPPEPPGPPLAGRPSLKEGGHPCNITCFGSQPQLPSAGFKYLEAAEATLWLLLKSKALDGRKFRRQHGVGRYILDLATCIHLTLPLLHSNSEGLCASSMRDSSFFTMSGCASARLFSSPMSALRS